MKYALLILWDTFSWKREMGWEIKAKRKRLKEKGIDTERETEEIQIKRDRYVDRQIDRQIERERKRGRVGDRERVKQRYIGIKNVEI